MKSRANSSQSQVQCVETFQNQIRYAKWLGVCKAGTTSPTRPPPTVCPRPHPPLLSSSHLLNAVGPGFGKVAVTQLPSVFEILHASFNPWYIFIFLLCTCYKQEIRVCNTSAGRTLQHFKQLCYLECKYLQNLYCARSSLVKSEGKKITILLSSIS